MRPDGVNAADTAWLLVASAFVLLMTPALALFYGGMVRRQNVLSTFMYVLAPLPIVSIEWAFGVYGLVFGPSVGGLIGSPLGASFTALAAATKGSVPALAFAAYQMMFAIITPALVAGAFVERMKFSSYVAFVALWTPLVYAPIAHWVWGEGGWLASLGALDFAGGTVVHASAGVSALVGAFVLGPRAGYPRQRHVPHNLAMTLTGAGLLWFGWFGFNAGSALASGPLAALALMTTHLGASAGALAWVLVEWAHRSKPTALGLASGLVAGLVAVTPAAGFVSPASAVAIGGAGAAACYGALTLKDRFGYDDSLDAFGVHGVGGIVGAVLTGVFADRALNAAGADGLLRGHAGLVARQALGVVACSAYAALATFVLLWALKAKLGLRVAASDESEGLDVAQHGEQGYTF
ncbi:MAG TPA: ammonium transporter [Polyangiaceae bacterium]|nr:ammonium transporter [Polyangiaceae bacterium]